jgi:hypothetical protein
MLPVHVASRLRFESFAARSPHTCLRAVFDELLLNGRYVVQALLFELSLSC